MKPRINVTKTFLPPKDEYYDYIGKIWQNGQLTNQGSLLLDFENEIRRRFGLDYFHFVSNGTLALQLAIHTLRLEGSEIITTPFSYVATTSSILWEKATPVFVDIEPKTFCIDAEKIEAAITPQTKAILAVHVFGRPCDVELIEAIAKRHSLKVIYDAAHAFGVTYKRQSLLGYGDISICSFHATKVFHTIEGGGIITKNKKLYNAIELEKRFGHDGDEHITLGINAKASEFQAAMGLCNLKYLEEIIEDRKKTFALYDYLLEEEFGKQYIPSSTTYNYAYYPVLFESESELERALSRLAKENIFPRRYFYPSLNELPYLAKKHSCPISEDISRRIFCLPLYVGLSGSSVKRICTILLRGLGHGG